MMEGRREERGGGKTERGREWRLIDMESRTMKFRNNWF